MTRTFALFQWIRWKLLVMALAGLALSMPTVNAHLLKLADDDQQEGATRVPSARSPMVEQKTKARTIVPSKRYGILVALQEVTYALEPLDPSAIVPTNPRQIGLVRAVGISSETQGRLFVNQDGSKIRILALTSPGALGIRIHFERFDIPAGDEVYVHGVSEDSHVAGPYTYRGPFGDGEFWTDTIEGETAVIEHHIKGEEHGLYISEISHNFRNVLAEQAALAVLGCHNDAMCYDDLEKNAVGRIAYIKDGESRVCTGTMLNNRTEDFAPYFLTANHCVSTPEVARTVETYWFYRTTACNSGVLSSGWVRTPAGASLLATDRSADSSLLRIFNAVPRGLVYSGWDAGAKSVGTSVFGLHHPGGSYLRRSSGFIAATNSSCSASGLVNGYNVDWTSGTIEGGSSGSGLWYTQGGINYLVGVLSCGPDPAYCESYGLYGKFSDFFPAIQTYMDQGDNGGNCAATAINIGQGVSASLDTTDCRSRVRGVQYYADRYSFYASAGQQVAISLMSSAFDTYLYLLGPDKSVIGQDDNGGGGTDSRVPPGSGFFTLPSSGTYIIEVTSYSRNATGNYTLSLTAPPGSLVTVTLFVDTNQDPNILFADGTATTTVRAEAKDSNGRPVSGVNLAFSTSFGSITQSATTNANGIAAATYTSGVMPEVIPGRPPQYNYNGGNCKRLAKRAEAKQHGFGI